LGHGEIPADGFYVSRILARLFAAVAKRSANNCHIKIRNVRREHLLIQQEGRFSRRNAKEHVMRLLSATTMTAVLLAASCGFANAQATKFSRDPAEARTMGDSDTRTYYRGARPYYRSGWNDYGYYEPGWNSYGAGVRIGPFGAGVGVGAWPEYNYRSDYYYGPRGEFYGPPHRTY
jgi:hypothetical protein